MAAAHGLMRLHHVLYPPNVDGPNSLLHLELPHDAWGRLTTDTDTDRKALLGDGECWRDEGSCTAVHVTEARLTILFWKRPLNTATAKRVPAAH